MTDPDVQDNKNLSHHYKVLKQFLDISDDASTRTKLSSSRALRAKEKLLKLSEAQFRELSTDVYDELKRRIDESRLEPLYLLPRSTFHPKRNQARQKLSSLPQTRFKDLVSDISYEIDRRHLKDPPKQLPSSKRDSTLSDLREINNSRDTSQGTLQSVGDTPILPSNGRFSFNKSMMESPPVAVASPVEASLKQQGGSFPVDFENKQTTIGAQSTTVIPTRANMTWSSDEEEPEDLERPPLTMRNYNLSQRSQQSLETVERDSSFDPRDNERNLSQSYSQTDGEDNSSVKSSEMAETHPKVSVAMEDSPNPPQRDAGSDKTVALNGLVPDKTISPDLAAEHAEEIAKLKSQLTEITSERDAVLDQLDAASKVHQEKLDLENELIRSRASNNRLEEETRSLKESMAQISSNKVVSGSDRLQSDSVKADLENLVDKLFKPNDSSAEPFATSAAYLNLKTEVERWQSMYQAARSDSIVTAISTAALGKSELASYVSPHGLLSIRMVADLHAIIESFVSYLNEPTYDVDILFDLVSRVSILASQLALQGETANHSAAEYAVCLREAVSYALTATRYQATFSQAFPKIILERAVGELTFALCDFVALAKLVEGSESERVPKIATAIKESSAEPSYDFGARPLRMANRLRASKNSPNASPTANRTIEIASTEPLKPKASVSFVTPPHENKLTLNGDDSKIAPPSKKIDEEAPSDNFVRINPLLQDSETSNKDPTNQELENYPQRDASLPQSKISTKQPLILSKLAASFKEVLAQPSLNPVSHDSNKENLEGTFVSAQDISPDESGDDENYEMLPSGDSHDDVTTLSASSKTLDSISITAAPKKAVHHVEAPLEEIAKHSQSQMKERSENSADIAPIAALTPLQQAESTNFSSPKSMEGTQIQIKSPPIPSHRPSPRIRSSKPLPQPKSVEFEDESNSPAIIESPVASDSKQVSYPVKPLSAAAEVEEKAQQSDDEEDGSNAVATKRDQARQRQEYRKSMAAATFNVHLFDIENPDNTLTQVLLYLEHQTVQVISTIQSLLSAIKIPGVKCGDLREKAYAITVVVTQMTGATNISMNQTRNAELKQHGSWVVENLDDCSHRMTRLSHDNQGQLEDAFADKNFKQRLAGISFDIAKCTKELVKTVEEASIREDIANLDARLKHVDDLT